MITVEAFYCPNCDLIVRGRESQEVTRPGGITEITGFCTMCDSPVKKRIHPKARQENLDELTAPDNATPAMKKDALQEYEEIQKTINLKDRDFLRLIEQFYEGDLEFARQLEPDPTFVAELKDDVEYERLLRRQSRLLWATMPELEIIEVKLT